MLEMETTDVSHQLATEFVLKTSENVFVTGKAGTGKTTFLRAVQKNSTKNTVVAAPTGVAAINAGGMTLHSLFQLPFNAFLPTKQRVPSNFSNIHSLFENFKFSKAKIELIKELELLIIDEVSMFASRYTGLYRYHFKNYSKKPSRTFWWCSGVVYWRFISIATCGERR
jgi:DNA replication protein DnaC